jgi:hypothetical protein
MQMLVLSRRGRLRTALAALACAAGVAVAGAAHAQAEDAPVAVVVDLDADAPFDAETLRAAIARELGVAVTSAAPAPGGTLSVSAHDGHVVVAFDSADGKRQARRTFDPPPDPEQALRDVALMAVNLARDQAGEFIRPEPPPPSPSPAPPSPSPARAPAAAPSSDTPVCERAGPFEPLAFDLLPGLRPSARHVSLGLVATGSSGIHGAAFGPVLTVDRAFVCGATFAGVVNVSSGPLSGAQLAGALNIAADEVKGAQLAGVANVVAGTAHGLQASGSVNVAKEMAGAQLSGGANVAAGTMHGLQASGGANFAKEMTGAQLSGAANVALSLHGLQIAGGVNVAGTVEGAQLGVANIVLGTVHGVQIGVVNVSKETDFALGLVNVATHGRLEVDVWGLPEAGLLLAGLKNGGAHYHYIYAAGVRPTDAHRAWGAVGLGFRVGPVESVFVDIDAVAYTELHFDSAARNTLYQGRVVAGYRIVHGLAVFGGPTYNVLESSGGAPGGVAPGYATSLGQTSNETFRGWPGVVVGLEGL